MARDLPRGGGGLWLARKSSITDTLCGQHPLHMYFHLMFRSSSNSTSTVQFLLLNQ